MAINLSISGKELSEIGSIGETPNFTDFTDVQIQSDTYGRLGLKEFEVDATAVLSGQTNDNDGKTEVLGDVEVQAGAYLSTVLTDSAKTYDVKIYVLAVERQQRVVSGISPTDYTLGGKYVPKDDIFIVKTRIDFNVS